MRRFYGYGQKVVGAANGVVTVRSMGAITADSITDIQMPPGPGTQESFGPTSLASKILPWVPGMTMVATQGVPKFKIGAQMSLPPGGIPGPGGSAPPPGVTPPGQQNMYQCPDGMIVTDPTLCEDKSSMKKYLLPAAIVVGALIVIKML